ncbi:MAG: 3'(2'),5'-bisphosphate nucleotidase [Rhodobacteraceae bacterium HLUCCA24]|nr:MAG: 3'(2'),5'-bisphosphate nucleotidase [Rhodobacteraceae bacterium HLUCCA24]
MRHHALRNLAVRLTSEHKTFSTFMQLAATRRRPDDWSEGLDHDRLSDVMRRLALEAGARIMQIYEAPEMGVRAKIDESPVTEADEAADALISAGLREAFPDVPLVTEEQAATHDQDLDTFLIVDPLDGTKEFVQRRGDFTVNIAYVETGLPVRGVVYAPAKKRLFHTTATGRAVEEEGPFDPDVPGALRDLAVAWPDNDALRVVASKSHRDAETDAYIARYRVADTKSAGSSLKFCLVASGEADLYPRLGRTMEWDTAAGHAILAGAGGRVIRFDDHTPLVYGKPGFANPFFIAHAPGVDLVES